MNLVFKRVRYGTSHYRRVRQLYVQAFPKIERLPLWALILMALRPGIAFYAVYDGDEFCGLLYLLNDPDHTLIFYFAVRSDLRGKGYGAEILKWLKSRKRSVSLVMESMRETCDNPEQRLRRNEFYLRNGFQDTGYFMRSRGIYDVLCTEPEIVPEDTARLIRRFTFWIGLKTSIEKF